MSGNHGFSALADRADGLEKLTLDGGLPARHDAAVREVAALRQSLADSRAALPALLDSLASRTD